MNNNIFEAADTEMDAQDLSDMLFIEGDEIMEKNSACAATTS